MNIRRHADLVPEPPGPAAIARWVAALAARLGMRRHWRWWLIGTMLAVVVLAVVREPLGALLWPQTRAQALRADAEEALARGLLTAPDGRGARELFEAAVAIDPDRVEARQGLARVALAAVARAREDLAADRLGEARRMLALARALDAPRARVDPVEEDLRRREAGRMGVDEAFDQAGRAHAEGRLDGAPGAALPLYARVLALEPAHPGALRGREDALAELLAQAREALRVGDVDEAVRLVATVRAYDGGHVDLPDTLARLMEESGLDAGALSRRLAGEEAAAGAVSAGQAGSAAFARDPEGRAREVARLLDVAARARAAAPATADGEEVRAVAAARELEPSAPGVVDAIGRLLPQARGCHAEAMRQNRLREASACLDARAALGDDAGAVAEARRQLAARWLAVGEERLGAGDVDAARAALAGARRADPGLEALTGFEQRVRAAAAALRLR